MLFHARVTKGSMKSVTLVMSAPDADKAAEGALAVANFAPLPALLGKVNVEVSAVPEQQTLVMGMLPMLRTFVDGVKYRRLN